MQKRNNVMNQRVKAKAERRLLIVEAAVACFVEKGIHPTGIRDIAARADISLGNLYNHFSGKDELIAEIAVLEGEGLARFIEVINEGQLPFAAVEEFADRYLDYTSEPENAILTIEIISEALKNPVIAEFFDGNRHSLVAALSRAIGRGVADGTMRADINTKETAKLLLDTIEGLGMRAGLARKKPSRQARQALMSMIRNALAASPGGV